MVTRGSIATKIDELVVDFNLLDVFVAAKIYNVAHQTKKKIQTSTISIDCV